MKRNNKTAKITFRFNLAMLLIDFVICYGVFISSFLQFGYSFFSTHLSTIFLFALCCSFAICFVLFLFKIYKRLVRDYLFSHFLIIFFVSLFFSMFFLFASGMILMHDTTFTYSNLLNLLFFSFILSIVLSSYRFIINLRIYILFFKNKKNKIRTLVIGAGGAGRIVVEDSIKNESNKHYVIAMLDDDPKKIGGSYLGVKVYGPIRCIKKYVSKFSAEEIIIAINELSKEKLDNILFYLRDIDIRVRRMPILSELNGPNDVKIINVDFNDLLCRDAVVLDNNKVDNMMRDKVVLITGAGGSIGSELVRQIFYAQPKKLILFDIYENSTYSIQMELTNLLRKSSKYKTEIITLIGSTYDMKRMEHIIKRYRPNYIYHAAAYKHVPLMEDSPSEAIRTNVIGTYNVAALANQYSVEKMILVSTDKAVRPTNVMGATKRFAETIIQYFSSVSKSTVYAAVRFGNVLGSNGSVVPLFIKQIELGGPVTITDKRIIRYFMTIPEAVSLILQCGLFAADGEIFVLDMGKPVKILSLAERLIKQFGLIPNVDIQIVETGLRPGEKLYEELLLDLTHQEKTSHNKIFVEKKTKIYPINEEIELIKSAFDYEEEIDVKKLLAKIIETYRIESEKKDNETNIIFPS